MELVLGRRRFDLDAGVVVVATVEIDAEGDDTVGTPPVPTSRSIAAAAVRRGALTAALADAELLIAAGADVVELDAWDAGDRGVPDRPAGSDALPCIVTGMTARLSVPVGVRTADPAIATACLDAGVTLVTLPVDAIDRCFTDTALVRALEANNAAVMVRMSSSRPRIAAASDAAASDVATSDVRAAPAAAPQAPSSDELVIELSAAAARARNAGLPIGRVLVDLMDLTTREANAAADRDTRDAFLRAQRAARLAEVVDAVDRLVHDGQFVAVGGWDDGDAERATALTSLMISRGARVVRSRSPRQVRRVARVVDAMSAATRPAATRPAPATRTAASRPAPATRTATPRTGDS